MDQQTVAIEPLAACPWCHTHVHERTDFETIFVCRTRVYNDRPDGEAGRSVGCIMSEIQELRKRPKETNALREAILEHANQRADDRCWLDDCKLYEAAGLPPQDNSVGDPCAMLENCKRFIEQRCKPGGAWKSYAELQADNRRLNRALSPGEGVWIYQGDGTDHPESLTCQVLMTADQLRELTERAAGYDDARTEASVRLGKELDQLGVGNDTNGWFVRVQKLVKERDDLANRVREIKQLAEAAP